jgi:hypothetical protein
MNLIVSFLPLPASKPRLLKSLHFNSCKGLLIRLVKLCVDGICEAMGSQRQPPLWVASWVGIG